MKKTTLENLTELKEKLPSFHERSSIIKIQKFNSYIEDHIYQQDQNLIDKKYNQYLESLDCYFNDFFNFYKHNDDYYKVYNKIIFLIDTFIENETNLELKRLENKKSILSKVKPLEENKLTSNETITTNVSDSEEIKISYIEHCFKLIENNFKILEEEINSLKENKSSLEERIKKLENKSSINDYIGINPNPYKIPPLIQPGTPYKHLTPYYTVSSTGEINKKEN